MTTGSLSNNVFERRTSTGSGLFSFFGGGFAQIFRQIASITVKKLRNTNFISSRHVKRENTSLPVDVRRSKTLFLKLPNGSEHRPRISVPCSRQRFCWPFIGFCHKINFDWSAVGDSFFAGISFLTTSPFLKAPQ